MSTAIQELAILDQWVVSKLVPGRDKQGNLKYDKPPMKLDGDRLIGASHSEPLDWATYAVACEVVARGIDGAQAAGFCFHESDPYTGVDFDGCRDPETGIIESWAWRWIRKLNSYTEISISGTGVKVWVRGKLPKALIRKLGPHKGIEVYSRQRFFWLTGQHLPETPETINDAQAVLDEMVKELTPPKPAPRKVSPGERAVERMAGGSLIERILCEHDLGDLLQAHGADLVYTRGSSRYYSGLNGDQHTHRVTYVVTEATKGPGQIGHSYSPDGKLNNVDHPQGFDYLNATEALEGKTWRDFVPEPKRQAKPDYLTRADAERRRKDAQRKREARKQTAAELRAEVEARAAADDTLTPCDRAVLEALLKCADARGWCRPSKERLAEMSGYSLGSIKRALATDGRLEGRYITSEGDGGGPNQTAIRTFLRGSSFATGTIKQPDDDPRISIERESIGIPVDTCEGGGQPLGEPDSLDTWSWCEDAHGTEELNALESAKFADLPKPAPVLTKTPEEPEAPGASYDQALDVTDRQEKQPDDPRAVPSWLRTAGDVAMTRRADDQADQGVQAGFFEPAPAPGLPFIRSARAAQLLDMPPALRGWKPKHAAQERKARDALAALASPPSQAKPTSDSLRPPVLSDQATAALIPTPAELIARLRARNAIAG